MSRRNRRMSRFTIQKLSPSLPPSRRMKMWKMKRTTMRMMRFVVRSLLFVCYTIVVIATLASSRSGIVKVIFYGILTPVP